MKQRGVALICVVSVLLLLALISVPFVLSMLIHEKEGTVFLGHTQARYAVTGARNFAVIKLLSTNQYIERKPGLWVTSYKTPYYDTKGEIYVSLKDKILKNFVNREVRWGIEVQDEQGKLNLLSTRPEILMELLGLIDTRTCDIKDFSTVYSLRESQWIFPQRIRSIISTGISVDDVTFYHIGDKVRITKPGLAPFYTEIVTVFPVLSTKDSVPESYADGVIEVERLHPVNINTASKEVLFCIFNGLATVSDKKIIRITRKEAEQLADYFSKRVVKSFADFYDAVMDIDFLDPVKKYLILQNAIEPRGSNGTLPFTFNSCDIFTIDAVGAVNYPTGARLSEKRFREVVDVAPPMLQAFIVESQYDFDMYFNLHKYAGVSSNFGFPFGSKIVSHPSTISISEGKFSDFALKPNDAYIQILPAEDYRGGGRNKNFREHFKGKIDGKKIQGEGLNYKASEAFSYTISQADIDAGGIEFWIKFRRLNDGTAFINIAEDEYSDRITLRYNAGYLELIAKDATLENKLSIFKFPFSPQPRTWYHIGAYYKSTYYGHLMILVDGFSSPDAEFLHVDSSNRKLITRLASQINQTTTTIPLEDSGILKYFSKSKSVPFEIGNEIVEYNPKTGTFKRGARGTTPRSHPAGATFQMFGYSNPLKSGTHNLYDAKQKVSFQVVSNGIPTGGSKLLEGFGEVATVTLLGKSLGSVLIPFIEPGDTEILVQGNINEFPSKGFIKIENEVVFYPKYEMRQVSIGGKMQIVPAFVDVERGMLGTTASSHPELTKITLFGFPIDTRGDYDEPAMIQIKDEWFAPLQFLQHQMGWYATGVVQGEPKFYRGLFLSTRMAHKAEELLIPVFACKKHVTQSYDEITLIDENHNRVTYEIKLASCTGSAAEDNDTHFVSLHENVSYSWAADGIHTRLLKFPSGELISYSWIKNEPNLSIANGITGYIDEIKFFASSKNLEFRVSEILKAEDDSVPSNFLTGVNENESVRVINVGCEIIGYVKVGDKYYRSYLNSAPMTHDNGDRYFNLSFLPVSALSEPISLMDGQIPLVSQIPGDQKEGYVLIDDEVIMHTNSEGNLLMPPDFSGDGLYRGMFGTRAEGHSRYSLVYQIPFRYWDTYKKNQFDNTMCWYQVSCQIPNAFLKKLSVDIENDDRNLKVKALVRIDPDCLWYEPEAGRIFEFESPYTFTETINRYLSTLKNGQVDVRFYFKYMPDSFYPNHTWKKTPKIREIRLIHMKNTTTLYHAEK